MRFVDVHTHLNMLERDAEAVIAAAKENNIEHLITIGTGTEDLPKVLNYANKYSPVVWGTLGYHPHDAKDFNDQSEDFMRQNLSCENIVAVGEIGLDYYYSHSEHDVQKAVMRKQMALAQEFSLPVEIHTRDAEADTIEILKEFAPEVRGLLHCFTGTRWLAEEALAIGYNISVSGVVTFKNADELRAVIKSVPLDRLHLETDSPFLTPVPFRGKKNEPSYMLHTAKVVAELKGISLEELALATTQNAKKLFSRMKI